MTLEQIEPRAQQWSAEELGPIQANRLRDAIRALTIIEHQTLRTCGKDDDGKPFVIVQTKFSLRGDAGANPVPNRMHCAIGERFGWTATKANLKPIIAALVGATVTAKQTMPSVDETVSP